MKSFRSILCGVVVVGIGWIGAASSSFAQAPTDEAFPGVKKALTPEQYAATGVSKLSPAEQGRLDEALRQYFSGASQRVAAQAASQAVDRAVEEKRVKTPTLIESRLTGTFTGFTGRTVFVLENGQRWKPVDQTVHGSFPPTDQPQVYIVRDMFGYKMAILGGTTVRVRRL